MVRTVGLTTVPSAFHARVIAARLASEGIVTQLRGNVDGPYPIGEVHILVGEDDLADARNLLLADEVESAFEETPTDTDAQGAGTLWVLLAVALLVVSLTVLRLL